MDDRLFLASVFLKKNQLFFKRVPGCCLVLLFLVLLTAFSPRWGFWAHKRINRLAVFRLPAEMQVFYKKHIDYIMEHAVNPDRRRYAVVGEAERHFIDLDVYGDSTSLPHSWPAAVRQMGEDSLRKHGIVPWYIQTAAYQLTEAFKEKDPRRILRISADLGHYIADAHVPLHTTRNYNGQLTRQEGIHGFWESRLPELYAVDYDLWSGQASYLEHVGDEIWSAVYRAHAACDSVFLFEKQLTDSFDPDKKFSYELRNNVLVRTYSEEFSKQYHLKLNGQVERQMKSSIALVGDVWFTCWIDAGQPDLSEMSGFSFDSKDQKTEAAEQQSWWRRLLQIRPENDEL
jgi:hypothetical protein